MYVSGKKIAYLGLLLALAMVLTLLGGYFEPSTLFFMAAAAFCTGIAVREWGLYFGAAFMAAGIILGVLLAPNKLYMLTYGGMSLYIYIREFAFEKIADSRRISKRTIAFWIVRYVTFNLMYIPILILFPKLIFSGELSVWIYVILIAAGQAALLIYEKAYDYFQVMIWGKLRRYLKI